MPYALLLSITVAILDLIPVIGSVVAGILVSLTALTVSLPVPGHHRVLRRLPAARGLPPLITVVAVIVGGAVIGVVGAVIAIPAAAAMLLLAREILFPRLDRA